MPDPVCPIVNLIYRSNRFENYSCFMGSCVKKKQKKKTNKLEKQQYKKCKYECDFPKSRHKITLTGLTCL